MSSARWWGCIASATLILILLRFFNSNADAADLPAARCVVRNELLQSGPAISSVAISQSGKVAVATDFDGRLHAWDLAKGERLSSMVNPPLTGYRGGPTIAISANDRYLAIAGGRNTAAVWDMKEGKQIHVSKFDVTPIAFVGLLGDGDTMVIADGSSKLYMWKVSSPQDRREFTFPSMTRPVRWQVAPGSDRIIAAEGNSDKVYEWKAGADAPTEITEAQGRCPTGIAVSHSGNYFAGMFGKVVTVHPLKPTTDDFTAPFSTKYVQPKDIQFSPNDNFLVTYGGADSIQVHSVASGAVVFSLGEPQPKDVTCGNLSLGNSQDNEWLAISGFKDGAVRVWTLPKPPDKLPETGPEVFRRVQKSLAAKNFAMLAKLATEYRRPGLCFENGDSKLEVLYMALTAIRAGETREEREKLLMEWIDVEPRDPTPHICMAKLKERAAWLARGDRFAFAVPEQAWKVFYANLDEARNHLADAKKLGAADAYGCELAIQIAKAKPQHEDEAKEALLESIRIDPKYNGSYTAMAEYLMPRWHGELGQVQAFATKVAQKLGGDDGDEMFARIVMMISNYEGTGTFGPGGFNYERFQPAMAGFRKRFPTHEGLLAAHIRLAQYGNDYELLTALIQEKRAKLEAGIFVEPKSGKNQPQRRPDVFKGIFIPSSHQEGNKTTYLVAGRKNVAVGFSGDKASLLMFHGDGTYINFHLDEKRMVPTYPIGLPLLNVAVSGDGSTMALNCLNPVNDVTGTLVRSFKKGTVSGPYVNLAEDITAMAFTFDGSRLATVNRQGEVALWDSEGQKAIGTFSVGDEVLDIVVSPNAKSLWTATRKSIQRWSDSGSKESEAENAGVRLALSTDGKLLFSLNGKSVNRLDPVTLKSEASWSLPEEGASIAIARSAKRIAIGGTGNVMIVDAQSGQVLTTLREAALSTITKLAFSPNGNFLAASSGGDKSVVWDISGDLP